MSGINIGKHIFFLIRYSIIQPQQKGWRVAENSLEKYISEILSDKRLDIREQMFENITIPSLKNQAFTHDTRSTVIIMVSDLLPAPRMERLRQITRCLEGTHSVIITRIRSGVASTNSFEYAGINEATKQIIKETLGQTNKAILATVRLDDDDGLSENYIIELSKHIKEDFAGYAVSFAYGLEGYYDESRKDISDIRHLYFPKNAQGLAYIFKYVPAENFKNTEKINVFNLGNHVKIDEQFPVIVYAKEPMYFRTLSKTNDSVDARYHKNLPKLSSSSHLSNFGYLKGIAPLEVDESASSQLNGIAISKECSQMHSFIQDLKHKIANLEKKLKEKSK